MSQPPVTAAENPVLIVGSAPAARAVQSWSHHPFTTVVVINNAWRLRDDWDVLIHPEDFPVQNRPPRLNPGQVIVTAKDYVPAQNAMGGFVYGGGTMAFTAGYWALAALKPSVVAYLGCDMMYPASGNTHFYGTGQADPLRADVSLRSLEAKSARLMLYGARQQCRFVRLSQGESRLVFPSATRQTVLTAPDPMPDIAVMTVAEAEERRLDYFVKSGRYWECEEQFDPDCIDALDQMWLAALAKSGAAPA